MRTRKQQSASGAPFELPLVLRPLYKCARGRRTIQRARLYYMCDYQKINYSHWVALNCARARTKLKYQSARRTMLRIFVGKVNREQRAGALCILCICAALSSSSAKRAREVSFALIAKSFNGARAKTCEVARATKERVYAKKVDVVYICSLWLRRVESGPHAPKMFIATTYSPNIVAPRGANSLFTRNRLVLLRVGQP